MEQKKSKKKKNSLMKKVGYSIGAVFLVLLVAGGLFTWKIYSDVASVYGKIKIHKIAG